MFVGSDYQAAWCFRTPPKKKPLGPDYEEIHDHILRTRYHLVLQITPSDQITDMNPAGILLCQSQI